MVGVCRGLSWKPFKAKVAGAYGLERRRQYGDIKGFREDPRQGQELGGRVSFTLLFGGRRWAGRGFAVRTNIVGQRQFSEKEEIATLKKQNKV